MERYRNFILEQTVVQHAPLVPEVALHLAHESRPIWSRPHEILDRSDIPDPFWAFAWAGGQAISRALLDNTELVRGRRVLDFASGCGIAAIAAMKAGAEHVIASEIDPVAVEAISLNAALNEVPVETSLADVIGRDDPGADVVVAGDVFYDRQLAARLVGWFASLAARGTLVLIGDPQRSYFPRKGLEPLAEYGVPVLRALEDREVRKTSVYRALPELAL